MTPVKLMENLAKRVRQTTIDYTTSLKSEQIFLGSTPLDIFIGWPPIRMRPDEKRSYIYCLALSWEDTEDRSTCKVEIGFSIYDDDRDGGGLVLYNLMEHIRQDLLTHRTLFDANLLVLPLQSTLTSEQPFPQWQGTITATYTIGQPEEEDIYGI